MFDFSNCALKETYTDSPWVEGYSEFEMTPDVLQEALATLGFAAMIESPGDLPFEASWNGQMNCWDYSCSIQPI